MNVAEPPSDETPDQKQLRLANESLFAYDDLEPAFGKLSNAELQIAYQCRDNHYRTWGYAVRAVWNERRFTFPNIVEDTQGCGIPACAFCGDVLYYGTLDAYASYHFNSDGTCKNGFTKDYTCVPCGRQFESLRLACKHRVNVQCLQAQRDKQRRYCEPCSHQSHTHQDHARHLASKTHHKTTHPDEFVCKDCDVRCAYKSEFTRHLKSAQHLKTQAPVSYTCEPCGVTCRCKTEYDRHCAGKFHRYKVNPSDRPTLTCELCGITRPSAAQYQTHLQTAKHRKKEAEARSEDPSSPDDEDASGSPDTQGPVPTHSPPPVC
jgi:hypothetical protein